MKLLDTSALIEIDRGDVERAKKLDDEGKHAVNYPSQIFGFGRGLKKLLWRGGRLA